MPQLLIRRYKSEDCLQIISLFQGAVHFINCRDYSQAQLDAWAPEQIDCVLWDNALSKNYSLVAETKGAIVGFCDIDAHGLLDHLYIHKNYQRQKIASSLILEIENYAAKKFAKIITHASITAKPFFENCGYLEVKKQNVALRGQIFINFLMEKSLQTSA